MAHSLDLGDLPDVLALEELGDHRYRAPFEARDDVVRDVVFGGQILAQMIIASALEDDSGKEVKSIHAIFARAADFESALEYDVDSMHAGRTFRSDTVTCLQGGRVMSRGLLLLSSDEPDLIRHTSVEMPDVPGPEDPDGRSDFRVFPGAVGLIVGGVNTWSDDEPLRPPVQYVWTRYPQAFAPDTSASALVNQAILSWATDGYLIGTAMLPHPGLNEGHAHRSISTGVVSHTINFHDRFDASDWLLLANQSVWAGRGRSYGLCNIFTRDGKLVATYTQDNMVRAFADGGDHSGDYERIM
ncbi:MAG: acyl-CoA thioesterase domain-containing protein [Acidimicrobiia bacterium]